MVRVSFLRPIDQFNGSHRLLQELRTSLQSDDYDQLLLSVAFAKSGPLLRLLPLIKEWKRKGKTIKAIFGIDLLGTSKQALEFALNNFHEVYIIHSTSHSTFHPKFYLFYGDGRATCYYGSHNLTVGGTETNFEGGVKVELDRPEDEVSFEEALSCWESLLPDVCSMTREFDQAFIDELLSRGLIFDESVSKLRQPRTVETSPDGSSAEEVSRPSLFPRSYPKPPSPIPKEIFTTAKPAPRSRKSTKRAASTPSPVASEALVIQIVPHHNGEVFLSKQAVDQNPIFFGSPFTGRTAPKRTGNPSYPQRDPDPVVNITVYDRHGNTSLTRIGFNLNTVFYEKKSEIRITFSPDLREAIEPYSMMVMRQTEEAHDYDLEIFNPGSDRYREYLAACNQTLPSGGSKQPRRMGWL